MTSYNIGVSFAPFRSKMPMKKKFVLGTCLIPIASGPLSESEWHDTYYTEPYRLAIFMVSLDIKQQKRDHMCCHQAILIPTLAFEVSEDEEIIAAPSAPPAALSAVSSRSSHPIRTQA